MKNIFCSFVSGVKKHNFSFFTGVVHPGKKTSTPGRDFGAPAGRSDGFGSGQPCEWVIWCR